MKKILIVDDDIYVTRLLSEMLNEEYKTKTAESGDVAMEMVYDYEPDIILLDLMMPGMSGFEVCKKIRSDNQLPYVKIILLSGKSFLDDRLEGYEAGANDFLTKPFNPEEVKAKIKIFLQLKYASEISQIKDELLTLLSHEKNTPLNSILGFAELLKQSDTITEEDMHYVNYILNSAKDLQNNTHKTLLLCQLKEGLQITPLKCGLLDMMENLMRHFKAQLQEKKLDVQVIGGFPNLPIWVDPVLMPEALECILENSIHYSFEKGVVTIQLESTDQECVISISDEGVGIEPEQVDKIFSTLLHQKVMSHSKGLGISLALAKAVIELHGGKIIVEQNRPKGAIFKVVLPLGCMQK